MKNYYFLFALPRSGSTLLAFVLNAHPQIEVAHEDSSYPVTDMPERETYNLSWKLQYGYDKYLTEKLSAQKKIVVATRYWKKKHLRIINQKIGNRAKFIVLTRPNMWRVFYRANGQYRLVQLRDIFNFWLCRREIKKLGLSHIEIDYVEMVAQPKETFAKICKFLGVEFKPEMLDYQQFDHSNLSDRGNLKTREFKGIVDKSKDERLTAKMVTAAAFYRLREPIFKRIK